MDQIGNIDMNATDTDHQELREWIHRKLFGWYAATEMEIPHRRGFLHLDHEFMCWQDVPDYPHDPAAAMAVLEKCLLEKGIQLSHYKGFGIYQTGLGKSLETHADTLPMTICLFAQKLFSK